MSSAASGATPRDGSSEKRQWPERGESEEQQEVEGTFFPDLHDLFLAYDREFFEGRGGFCSIRLSEPLLKFRTVKEFREVLLHEMIHALLFLTRNSRDREAHGPEFIEHMERINAATGLNITVFHTFHDEVDYHRTHIWRCDGVCRSQRPYFGYVKRAMNRSPGPSDWWCVYHKIAEPSPARKAPSSKKRPAKDQAAPAPQQQAVSPNNYRENKQTVLNSWLRPLERPSDRPTPSDQPSPHSPKPRR